MSRWSRNNRRWAAVLGCGPAGLFATHALMQNGWNVRVFSKMRKSEMFGVQYLHAPIPGLTDGQEPRTVKYQLNGDVSGYREKVYGPNPVKTSVEMLESEHLAWDIRAAYDRAWEMYSQIIMHAPDLSFRDLGVGDPDSESGVISQQYEYIISSIPAPALCFAEHRFHTREVWAAGDAPERGTFCPIDVAPDDTIICDGTRDVGWYRTAKVFGYRTAEWPERRKPPYHGVTLISKPISTDCDCFLRRGDSPFKVLKVGRFGAWNKTVLSHTAYTQAAQL